MSMMKKIIIMMIAAIMVVACTTRQKAEQEKTLAQQLEQRLDSLRKKGYMFGHQDDPFYGVTWEYLNDRSSSTICVVVLSPSAGIHAILLPRLLMEPSPDRSFRRVRLGTSPIPR